MKKLLFSLLFILIALPLISANKDPEPEPPPIKDRRMVVELALEPLFDNKCEWSYPAVGKFTWVVTSTMAEKGYFLYLTCHNPVDDGRMETHLVVAPAHSYRYVASGQWAVGWVDEYTNFDGLIKFWHFSAILKENYQYWQQTIFRCFDDIPPTPEQWVVGNY